MMPMPLPICGPPRRAQIGKGVGIIGKTILRARQREDEAGVPAEDPAQRDRVRGRLQRARRRLRRGLDEAQGRRGDGDGWRLNGQKTWTTSAHFAEWYWVGARTDPEHRSTTASRCSSCRSTSPASRSTASGRWATSAPTTCSSTTCFVDVHDDYVVGEVGHGFDVHLTGPRPRALHHVHVLADPAAPGPAVRLRRDRDRRRRAAQVTTRAHP